MKSKKPIPYKMLSQDAFSRWLGIEIIETRIGYCKVGMFIRKEMLNGMGKAHGGISFSLADTALAFAANSFGRKAVSIEASINHIESLEEGDYIIAEADLNITKNKLGFHFIEIKKEEQKIAFFKAVVYRSNAIWEEE